MNFIYITNMEQDVIDKMERGVSLHKLDSIEHRLTGVETTLQELIENTDEMKEEIKDKLQDVQFEMEKNTSQVKRLQRSYQRHQANSRYIFCVMIALLVVWTIGMHWWKMGSI